MKHQLLVVFFRLLATLCRKVYWPYVLHLSSQILSSVCVHSFWYLCLYLFIFLCLFTNEHLKEIMGVKEKPDIIDIIERKRLQWYGHVKRMQDERLTKLTL